MINEIRIKASNERSPRSNMPLFELWINGRREGIMNEFYLKTGEKR